MTPAALFAGVRRCGLLSTASYPPGKRQPGERNCTRNFVLCFCLIFFRAFASGGDRASSRGLVLRLGLRHHRSDPSVGPVVVSLHRSGDTAVPLEEARRRRKLARGP